MRTGPAHPPSRWIPLKITLVYAIAGALWILFSDTLVVELFRDPAAIRRLSIAKGWIFILVTSALLYGVLGRYLLRIRRQQAELEKSEELYWTLFENSSSVALLFDPASLRIIDANAAACAFYGHPREAFLGKSLSDLNVIPPEQIRANVARIRTRKIDRIALTHRLADGALRDVESFTGPVTISGRELVFSIVHDVTDRVRAEAALLRRGRQLEILSTAIQRINSVLDIPVILRTLVASAIEIVGATSGTAGLLEGGAMVFTEYNRGGTVFPIDYVFPPGRGVPGHVIATKRPYIANDAERDGHVLPEVRRALSFRALVTVPIVDRHGELIGCFEIHDTVDRRPFDEQDVVMLSGLAGGAAVALENARMLAELQRTGREIRRLATAVEQAAEAVVITDAGGAIQYVNPAFERIAGYRRDELEGKTPAVLKSGVHDAAFYREMWETIRGGRAWRGSFVNRRKDGTIYEEEAVISPVRAPSGEIVHYVAVKRDVTYERKMEEQLRNAQKMEAVGRLAGGVAHDFNNLLTAIIGYAELLAAELVPGSPLRRDADEIERAGKQAATLIRQLLAFGRRQVLKPEVLELNAVVAEVENMLRRLIGEDVELLLRLSGALWAVKADRSQIEQVIVNLAVNARDAMPSGGKLSVVTENFVLRERDPLIAEDMEPGEYVRLSIRDTGHGMDRDTMSRIFEPFFTTKETGKGTGLGLASVYGIVRQSGGHIRVESAPGEGTTFSVYLPRAEDAAAPARPPEPVPAGGGGSETVLLVEDSDFVRALTHEILRLGGYRVLDASNGEEAIGLCRIHPGTIDLVLTDVVMPGMSGRELSERVKTLRPGIRVLYMSGYTDEAIARHGVLEPGMAFIEKPFTPDDLVRKVREILGAPGSGPEG